MEADLKKTVVVTGAAGGMGKALSELLIKLKYDVIGIDEHEERLSLLAKKLGKDFFAIPMNLSETTEWEDVFKKLDQHSNIRSLINLAGSSIGNSIEKLEESDWERSLKINVTAPMKLSKFLAPKMAQLGGGSILNVSSPVGIIGARKPSYAASKAALTGLTMSLAKNLGKDNIKVNMILPGTTITYMTNDWSKAKRESIAAETHLGRLCEANEFAETVSFLISDKCSYMSGAIIDMTCGGMIGH